MESGLKEISEKRFTFWYKAKATANQQSNWFGYTNEFDWVWEIAKYLSLKTENPKEERDH